MTTSKPQDYPIRVSTFSPIEFQGGMDEMDRILDACQPDVVMKAGRTYMAAHNRLSTSAGNLQSQMNNLKDVWKGDDAEAAVEQMERLRKTAENMSKVASETGGALGTYGEQLDWYKSHRPGRGNFAGLTTGDAEVFAAGTMIAGPGGGMIAVGGKKLGEALGLIDNEEDKIAREHMNRLAERTVQANDALPKQVTVDIPYGGITDPPNPPMPQNPYGPGGPGGPGSPSGPNIPKNPYGDLPKDPYGDGGQSIPKDPYGGGNIPGGGPGIPNDPYGGNVPGGGGSDLAGLPGGGGGFPGAGSDPFGRGIGGGGAGGGIGGGAGGLGAGAMGAGGMAGGMPGGGRGAGANAGKGAGRGLGGARGGVGGMAGGGGAPGGRGGGKGEEENERSTWLVEDEDVWGASDGDAAPPVIS